MSVVLNKNKLVFLTLSLVMFFLLSVPAFGADNAVGKLSSFTGKVLIKSKGSWGVDPVVGLSLYSGDKIVTSQGSATITFDDGAVMEIKKNSNLTIEEHEKKKGFFKKVTVIERRLRLMVGKLFFKTGKGPNKAETRLETPTMVCGLRGTAGIISIGADGAPYVQFSEGGTSYTIGDFISGVAQDVPDSVASMNPAQKAAFVATVAAQQAKTAKEAAVNAPEGSEEQVQAAYAEAQAAELAAQEAKEEAAILVENSPDPEVVEQAQEAQAEAEKAIESAQEAKDAAVESGATPVEVEVIEQQAEEEQTAEEEAPAEEEQAVEEEAPAEEEQAAEEEAPAEESPAEPEGYSEEEGSGDSGETPAEPEGFTPAEDEGGIPDTPPVSEEPPITDVEPASPV